VTSGYGRPEGTSGPPLRVLVALGHPPDARLRFPGCRPGRWAWLPAGRCSSACSSKSPKPP